MSQSRDERRTHVRAARLSTIRCLHNINKLLNVYEDTGILKEALLYAAVDSIHCNILVDLDLARAETLAQRRERLARRTGRVEGV